jgi:gliding motility-associated-like protein
MKSKIILLLLSFLAINTNSWAQLDVRHWIPPFYAKPGNGTGIQNINAHFVSLSTLSIDPIPVTIRNGLGQLIDIVEISKDAPAEYSIGIGNSDPVNFPLNIVPTDSLNTVLKKQGLTFSSFRPFFVNMRHKSGTQGTSLTSKGRAALGQRFYSGHLFTIYNTTAEAALWNNERRSHSISVMATEDNTTVTFDMIKLPIALVGFAPGEPVTVTLNANESFVVGIDHSQYSNPTINNANGIRITSDKDIVCNSGSWLSGNQFGQDIGYDQIVPAEVVGQEYILVRGLGDQTTEHPIVVATEDNTEVYLNDDLVTPAALLNEGEYFIVPTESFTANGNMYIVASQKVYVYQTLSGSSLNIGPTVGLNFIPPLNCVGAKVVNIPFVNSLAGDTGGGRINILSKLGASIYLNGDVTPLTGALPVTGNSDWVTYAFDPTTDNVFLESDSIMNVALLTRDDLVGTAGYFSGFTLQPVVGLTAGVPGSLPCVPGNAIMQVFGFDSYQWYFNGEPIEGATSNTLIPNFAGEYQVEGIDEACGFRFLSDIVELPLCPSTIGAAKDVQNVAETFPGSKVFDVTYRVYVVNFSITTAQNIQVIEDVLSGLANGATAILQQAPTVSSGVLTGGINPTFNGVSDKQVLTGLGTMPGSSTATIDYTIRVDMNNAVQDGYINQVVVTTTEFGPNDGISGPFTGQDFSNEGSNADPNGNLDPNEIDENEPTLVCFFSNEITYTSDIFCITDTDQEVTLDGINVGVYTVVPDGLVLNPETGLASVSLSTPGTYEVTFTTGGRCPSVTTTGITIIATPNSGTAINGDEICGDNSTVVDLDDLLLDADLGGVWTDSSGNELDGNFTPSTGGTFVFTYTTTAPPCAASATEVTIVAVDEPNSGTAVAANPVCIGGSIDLADYIVGEDGGGIWLNVAGDQIPSLFTPLAAGQYFFTYQVENDICGVRTTTLPIEVLPPPDSGVSLGESSWCQGDEIDLSTLITGADAGGTWTDEDGEIVSELIVPGTTGTFEYTYTVELTPCEPQSTSVTINVVAQPNSGTADSPYIICIGEPAFSLFTLLTDADTGGEWTDSNGNPVNNIFDPSTLGSTIRVYTISSIECNEVSTSITIQVTNDGCTEGPLVIPQGFSPNSDGIADNWVIQNLFLFPDNTVKIFNRWGAEVFAASPYQNNWNGRAQTGVNSGSDLPTGTYWYILDLGDGSDARRGYVYLNR